MVNDITLISLTNLFALFGSRDNIDVEQSKETLKNYMTRHYGIRNCESFIATYDDLRDLYGSSPDLDKDAIVEGICSNLTGKISAEDQEMVLLRLMQFCVKDELGYLADDELFIDTAKAFGIEKKLFLIFCDFVGDKESDYVHKHEIPGIDGHITTMWLPRHNRMLFTYYGHDKILMDDVPVLPETYQTWSQSGVLRHAVSGKRLYFSNIYASYAQNENKDEVVFCGRDINFRFHNSDNGLHDFSFTQHGGDLVAIMGPSGAGKSTLLSLLNGSMAPDSGSIEINGHSISDTDAKQLIGFVPQEDLLVEELTVYQNLMFTARLCFEGMTEEELDKRVMEVLRQLGLDEAKDLKVGSAINKFISGGQRKRLNIALELIREPAVLFLDEPTSGLSSNDTEKVINLLKEQTYKGRLIILTIHQPSSDVYKQFDRLWVIDAGGYPVFEGNPIEAITYFKTAANYADADASTCPVCGNVNPEVVLNILDEKALDESGKLTNERKVQPKEWHKMHLEHREVDPEKSNSTTPLPRTNQKKPGVLRQLLIQLQRTIHTKITNLQYLLITILEAPVLTLICATLTYYSPNEEYTVMDNRNLVSYMFMAIIVAIFIGMSGSAEEIIKDRALLKREKFLNLSYGSYIASKIIFMGFVTLFQTLLFVIIGNSIMGISGMILEYWGILFLVAFLSGLVGLLLSQCLNSVVAIYISIPIALIPQILLCGLVVDFADLVNHSTTGNVPVAAEFMPSRWAYESLAVTQYVENDYDKDLFAARKEKHEAQYYQLVYLYEVQSQLAQLNDERTNKKPENPKHLDIIRKALPTIDDVCQLEPYNGDYSYASLRQHTDKAEAILADRGNKALLAEDNIMAAKTRQMGKEALIQLKKDNHNLQLEAYCTGQFLGRTHDIVDGHIVARTAAIFLTPRSKNGRAPMYSPEKVIGSKHIFTPIFNSLVQIFMCIVLAIMLFTDYPGRLLRK